MISYKPTDWIKLVFSFHKSDTFRKLFWFILLLGIYCFAVHWLEHDYLKMDANNTITKLNILHSILGLVMSLLLVFRTNTAYDRWWEGRKAWGSLVNSSRNLASKLNALLPKNAEIQRRSLSNLLAYYPKSLAFHLYSEETRLALSNEIPEDLGIPRHITHQPNFIMSQIHKEVIDLKKDELITSTDLLLIDQEIRNYAEVCGICERIKNTPIPYSYSSFLRKFILTYILTLPIVFSPILGLYVIPFSIFIFYVLASLELIAEEIEDPFGGDENDIPTEKIAGNIAKSVKEFLHKGSN